MTDVIIASSPQDARVLEEVQNHHAELLGALTQRVESLAAALSSGGQAAAERDDLAQWAAGQLVPHVRAEHEAVFALGATDAALVGLLDSVRRDAEALAGLVADLRGAEGVSAAVAAGGIRSLFAAHVTTVDDQLLPDLAAAADLSVAEAFAARPEILTGAAGQAAEAPVDSGHDCTCGEHDDASYPELDARVIAHAIRHATIFGALDAVKSGAGMILIAPHDPLPLLRQIESRAPGAFEISYLQRGPEDWRLLFLRR